MSNEFAGVMSPTPQASEFPRGSHPAKRAYAKPSLVQFGQVKDLVKSGSGTVNEANSCTTSDTHKKSCSDRLLKENIVRVGAHPSGVGLYLFDYKSEYRDSLGHGRRFGVMADEVEAILPQAVSVAPNGFKQVDYSMLGIDLAA